MCGWVLLLVIEIVYGREFVSKGRMGVDETLEGVYSLAQDVGVGVKVVGDVLHEEGEP